ncbi:MAG: LytTR family DNA-binding domain-containing protein [Eubacteriales bacterium]|nr:LytTR family DNA-binding domain-containing protein [Eubacteriales bacterium]
MKDILYLKEGRNRINLPFEDIVYAEKYGAKVIIHAQERDYFIYETYISLQKRLDDRFIRPHESFIFNLDHISSIENSRVKMDNNACVGMCEKCIRKLRRGMDENACKY